MALARAARGVPVHLVQRGRLRAACFGCERDRLAWLALLRGALERFECALHAYVLMGNHVHLLLTPARADGPGSLMSSVAQGYARIFRGTRAEAAPAWDAASVSAPLYARRQVLACMRYIELNPVRAGIVREAADFRWSSYRANALGESDELLTPHGVYCALGHSAAARCAKYRASFGSMPGRGDGSVAARGEAEDSHA